MAWSAGSGRSYGHLRDDAQAYAERLREAGVPVEFVVLPGMIHACIHMIGVTSAARQAFDVAGAQMRRAFQR
nr:alpha/beta hydrolase fold domain-containing protein [Burkholderia sp. Ac-20344]